MKIEDGALLLIDVNDPNELHAWSASLGVTEEQLQSAVAQVGSSADKVAPFLQRSALVQAETARYEQELLARQSRSA